MVNNPAGSEWLIIVNPNAGHEKGRKDWDIISRLLTRYHIDYQARFTVKRRHAIELTKDGVAEGFRKIIAVGGDGTMNEVVNGVFTQTVCSPSEITLAIITVGTGNDWGKLFGIPGDYETAIRIIAEGKSMLQDTGIVRYYNGVIKESRYFINIAGLGFDAVVTRRTNIQKDKGRKGKLIYLYNLLRSLISYRHTVTSVAIDGNIIRENVFTISIGIGRFSGGGMMQTPNALPDDGLFDITIIRKITRRDVISSLKMLYDGTILEHPKISGYTGRNILIDSDPLIHVETDGESLGHSPIEFSILPRSVNVIYGTLPS